MWQADIESSDIDFVYADTDTHENEMSELYSYSEENDFLNNLNDFETIMKAHSLPSTYSQMNEGMKDRVIDIICDYLEMSDEEKRWLGVGSLLYLVQGNFADCSIISEQVENTRTNIFKLYSKGLFLTTVQLLHWQIHICLSPPAPNLSQELPEKKSAVTIADSKKLRMILSTIYTFVEVMRVPNDTDTDVQTQQRAEFREELSLPLVNNELLAITLFQMSSKFCSGSMPSYPIRKILLVLWKTLLVSLGGIDELKKLKDEYRREMCLPPEPDDTHEVVKTMRPASPPVNANEVLEAQNQRKANRPFKRQMIVKQSSVAGNEDNGESNDGNNEPNEEDLPDEGIVTSDGSEKSLTSADEESDEGRPSSPRPATPTPDSFVKPEEPETSLPHLNRGLPWKTKVRYKEMDAFLDQTRNKFLGYKLPGNDRTTTAGLPEPILEGIKVLENYVYVSLTEMQTERELQLLRFPLTVKEVTKTDGEPISSLSSPTEQLYAMMLPGLSQYMIALLKILLAAAPTSRTKNESINIVGDVMPEQMPSSVLDSMKMGIDVSRHKEIIIKSISGILFLLLKHYKINHVFQFEYIAQQLMFANCIPLVLKFFNQNICSYVSSKHSISVIDFPSLVIGQQPELTTENLQVTSDTSCYSWRNMFSCINLLRILNKLTKWKHSRIMMLVVFKSAPILKRALKLRHAMLQLYILKLLKMQAKYLGRQWRKSNMKIMSAIYQKVRHRLTDDWAFGNDLDARPWDFQAEEFALQVSINRFHYRRYSEAGHHVQPPPPLPGQTQLDTILDSDLFTPVDNNLISVLSKDKVQLTPSFKQNYNSWLEREVFENEIDWTLLLNNDTVNM